MQRKHVVVIGGGITGLTACYRLVQAAQARALPLDVTLLEASERVGGVIATRMQDDVLYEDGPDCFLAAKPWGVRLCEELGLHEELIGTTTQHRRSFIVRKDRLLPVPQGFYLMAPGALWPWITTPVFSWPGKFRMALDLLLPRCTSHADESLAHFVTRRLGREALERMAQPMIGGIYTGDPQHLSMQAIMPQFLDMERQYRSLIWALHRAQRTTHPQAESTSGPRYGLFVSFRRGMQTLVDALAERLPAGTVRLHTRVTRLHWRPERRRWQLQLDTPSHESSPLEADALCLCVPAPQAGQLFGDVSAELAAALRTIPYASSAIVNLVYKRTDVGHPLDGMGFVVPVVEQRTLLACSFSSVKFAGRAQPEQVLLRAFVGGALQPEQYARHAQDIQTAVQQDLRHLLRVRGEPLVCSLQRHPEAMAQYHVGHCARIAHLDTLAAHLPGIALAGNAYRGVGIPDCIRSGDSAAQTLLTYLTTTLS